MRVTICTMTMRHYDAVLELWKASPGVHVGESDARPEIARYLRRNRGLSLVAMDGPAVVGAVLAGHDGRRGLLHHMVVAPRHRRRGLGRRLVSQAIAGLKRAGILRAWIIVMRDNRSGRRFWKSIG